MVWGFTVQIIRVEETAQRVVAPSIVGEGAPHVFPYQFDAFRTTQLHAPAERHLKRARVTEWGWLEQHDRHLD